LHKIDSLLILVILITVCDS